VANFDYHRDQDPAVGMRTDGKAEVQHYVPQVLWRLHVKDASTKRGSEHVWCFDKKTQKVFSPNIRGVLAGTRFYEVEVNGETLSLEEPLSEIEGLLAPILGRLVLEPKLASLSKEDRFTIASFCAAQMVRTPRFRDRVKDMNEGVAVALRKRGIDPAQVSNFQMLFGGGDQGILDGYAGRRAAKICIAFSCENSGT
jgi:hypothetical protein